MEPWERYTYRVEWSDEDGEFVGLCAELPGLSWLARTQGKALSGIVATVRESVAILRADEEPVPKPLATRKYSGVFKVRVPPDVHRSLALEAAEQNISLNRMVTVKLARGQQAALREHPVSRRAKVPSRRRQPA